MATDAIQQIELFTPADYVGALKRIEPTVRQLEMLRVHLAAPDQTITARHLALALGFANWSAANLHYGKFAGQLCNALNVSPSTKLSVLVEFFKEPNSEFELRLRPSVIEALAELGIVGQGTWSFQEELGAEEQLVEGASFTVQVNAFERNPVAREKCIAHYGTSCTVCGFNFGAAFGSSAEGYTHVHHLKPLASIGEEYVIDPIKDLRPVCANCHAVIHLRRPPYSVEEIKSMLDGDSDT
jgi:5-methylcytosine-specific restriction protein A